MIQNKKLTVLFFSLVIFLLLPITMSWAQAMEKPGPKDTCPVCGMFVALYPDWTALTVSEDGSTYFFDGAKDMFKFILNPKKWAPHLNSERFTAFKVTDYYTLSALDAEKSVFVIGSDVLGPMGHELIPLADKEAAAEFMADHNGVRMIQFDDVTEKLLEKMDSGIFK